MENFTNQGFETIQKPVHIDMLTYAGSAFGSTIDGEQVFINGRIVETMGLDEGMVVMGHLLPNYPDKRANIPWRAMRVSIPKNQEPTVEEPEPVVEPEKTPGDLILEVLSEVPHSMYTTTELTEELGIDTKTANNWCMSLHNRGLIARADVHAGPNQKRASFVLWAKNSKVFA